ncbi:MAG TPA: hypothetical protein VK801_18170 [Caulobacteraceae bacterium]|jgi:hypothetical protein|nr:hypothetical protein [Caulobacteraceae bacterium]
MTTTDLPIRSLSRVRDARFSSRAAAPSWIHRVVAMIRKDPLVILVGVWDAIFYGGMIALLAYL